MSIPQFYQIGFYDADKKWHPLTFEGRDAMIQSSWFNSQQTPASPLFSNRPRFTFSEENKSRPTSNGLSKKVQRQQALDQRRREYQEDQRKKRESAFTESGKSIYDQLSQQDVKKALNMKEPEINFHSDAFKSDIFKYDYMDV